MKPLLVLDNVSVYYPGTFGLGSHTVINNINFTVRSHGFVSIIGHNGTGKSTLLRTIARLHPWYTGTLNCWAYQMGYLPEQPNIPPWLTAYKTLVLTANLADKNHSQTQAMELLAAVGLADYAYQRIGTFSKGMKQRLSFARLLLLQPEIILLDEPMSGLDHDAQMFVGTYIEQIYKEGTAIVLAEHQQYLWQSVITDTIQL